MKKFIFQHRSLVLFETTVTNAEIICNKKSKTIAEESSKILCIYVRLCTRGEVQKNCFAAEDVER
jgi:hypothetical protein